MKWNAIADAASVDPNYFFNFGQDLEPAIWYKMEITPGNIQPQGLFSTPIQIRTVSSTAPGYIVYDLNLAFGYLFLSPMVPPTSMTINVVQTTYLYDPYDPGAQFYVYIDVTPSIDAVDGALVYIMID